MLKGARAFEFEQIGKELQEKAHETVLEINFNNLVSNYNYYRSKIKPETKLMVMVKAFGYGSGNFEVSNIMQFRRADYLTVAFADEGVELRRAGINLPIMVMSPEVNSYDNIIKYHLEPEVFSFRNLTMIENAMENMALPEAHPLNIHIKLDTGMHRLGFSKNEIPELIQRIKSNPMLRVASVFSHLATADNPSEDEFTLSQIHCFEEGSQMIVDAFPYKVLRHILNTAGITRFTKYQFDMVRLGIGLYGVPTCEADKDFLQPVVSLKTTINQIKNIPAGDSIGYNRHGRAERICASALSRLAMPTACRVCLATATANLHQRSASEGDWRYLHGYVHVRPYRCGGTGWRHCRHFRCRTQHFRYCKGLSDHSLRNHDEHFATSETNLLSRIK